MKDLKEKLFKEMDERMPEMSDRLNDYPITKKENKFLFSLNWKVLTPILSVILIALIVIPFLLNDKTPTDQIYMLEVNPTIIIKTDADDNVVEIKSGNKDADEVLVSLDINNLIGQKLTVVSEVIADELLQLGYFDAEDKNVIKISSTNDSNKFEEALTNYFSNQGYFVAIFDRKLDLDSFNEKFETNIKDINGIYSYIDSLNDYYVEQVDYNNVDIKELYKTEYLEVYLKDTLEKELETIIQTSECLLKISDNYLAITQCEDIPFFAREYWLAKSYYELMPNELTDGIKELFDQMDASLKEYQELTGNDINDQAELLQMSAIMQAMPVTEILDIIDNIHDYISSSDFDAMIDKLLNFFQLTLPSIASELEELKDIPENVGQLVSKIKKISLKTNEENKKKYQAEYEKDKDQISKENYQQKLDEIINEYGSLENFWKNKKNIQ